MTSTSRRYETRAVFSAEGLAQAPGTQVSGPQANMALSAEQCLLDTLAGAIQGASQPSGSVAVASGLLGGAICDTAGLTGTAVAVCTAMGASIGGAVTGAAQGYMSSPSCTQPATSSDPGYYSDFGGWNPAA
jgi:hypothetical protein